MRHRIAVLNGIWILLFAFIALNATAQEAAAPTTAPSIVAGGPAPAFAGKMIQGDPVTAFEPGKLYIMEFWATWCMPCRAAIPHINELHNQYKDKNVVVIGQSVWETKPEAPVEFAEKNKNEMTYRVAVDHTDGEPEGSRGVMARTWLKAAGLNGIPSTWLVKDGKVLWIGHPMDLDAAKIDAALNGTFDIINAQRANAAKTEKQKQQAAANTRYWDAMHDRDEAGIDAAIKDIEAFYPDRPNVSRSYRVRADVVLKKYDEALALAKSYTDGVTDPKQIFGQKMQGIQDMIVTNPKDPTFLAQVEKELDAMQIPETDNRKGAEAMLMKLRAWICSLEGDYKTAVELQEKVVEMMSESPLKPVELMALDAYRAGKSPAMIPKHSRDSKKPAAQPATQPKTLN